MKHLIKIFALIVFSISLAFTQPVDKSIKWYDVGSQQFKVQPIPFIPMDSTLNANVTTPTAGKGNIFLGLDRKMYAKWVDGVITEIGGGGATMTKQQIVDKLNESGTNWFVDNLFSIKHNSNQKPAILLNNESSKEALRLTKYMYGAPSFVSGDQSITFYKDTAGVTPTENLLGSLRFRKETTDSGMYLIYTAKVPEYVVDPPSWGYGNLPVLTMFPYGGYEMWKRPNGVTARKITIQLGTLTANRTVTYGDGSGTHVVAATSPLSVDAGTGNISLGTVAVTLGGTGSTSLTSNALLVGNGTSAVNTISPGSANTVLQSNGTAWSAKQIYYTGTINSTNDEVDVNITGLSASSVVYANWGKSVTGVPLGVLYVVSTGTNTCKIRSNSDEQYNHNIVVTVVSW